jgi:hypothetical protein
MQALAVHVCSLYVYTTMSMAYFATTISDSAEIIYK